MNAACYAKDWRQWSTSPSCCLDTEYNTYALAERVGGVETKESLRISQETCSRGNAAEAAAIKWETNTVTWASVSECCFSSSLPVFTENILQTGSKQLCQQAFCLQRRLWSTHWRPTSCSAADPDLWPLCGQRNTRRVCGDRRGVAQFDFCPSVFDD